MLRNVKIKCDNQSGISLAKNPGHRAKIEHVDVQLHFIRDHVKKGTNSIEYCSTKDMLVDLMTERLARERHAWLFKIMGVASTPPSSSEDDYLIQKVGQHGTKSTSVLRGPHAVSGDGAR